MDSQLKKQFLYLYKQFKLEDQAKKDRFEKWRNLDPKAAEFISLIIRGQQSKHVLEIGTSNGFSSLWFADALKSTHGELTTIEIDVDRTQLAKKYLMDFDLIDPVTLISTDAKDYLNKAESIFDLVFLDSERKSYVDYWPDLRRLLDKKGSLLVVDNVISHRDELVEFIALLEQDITIGISIINIGAGMLLATKH